MRHAPSTGLRPRLRAIAAWTLLTVLTAAGACRKGAPPSSPPEDAAERAQKAGTLYRAAQAAMVPEKYDHYRRVIALYGDTSWARDAYFELVVSLLHEAPPLLADAMKAARAFRDRYPTDERVGESFLQIADAAYSQKDAATRGAALDDWSSHLEARDVANDVPKAGLYAGFVQLRLRQERWADAEVAIETALAEPDLPKFDRVEILVRKASLVSEKLGNKPRARAALEDALKLARELHAAKIGRLGITPAQIEEEIKKLGG